MPKVGDYILVHMVDEVTVGQTFLRSRLAWPLHITLVRWFTVGKLDELLQRLTEYAATQTAYTSMVGKEAAFGLNNETPVNLMADPEPLRALHMALVEHVRQSGGSFESEQWFGPIYKPHITLHGDHRRFEGDVEVIDGFHLVRVDEERLCTVVQYFPLRTKQEKL